MINNIGLVNIEVIFYLNILICLLFNFSKYFVYFINNFKIGKRFLIWMYFMFRYYIKNTLDILAY